MLMRVYQIKGNIFSYFSAASWQCNLFFASAGQIAWRTSSEQTPILAQQGELDQEVDWAAQILGPTAKIGLCMCNIFIQVTLVIITLLLLG